MRRFFCAITFLVLFTSIAAGKEPAPPVSLDQLGHGFGVDPAQIEKLRTDLQKQQKSGQKPKSAKRSRKSSAKAPQPPADAKKHADSLKQLDGILGGKSGGKDGQPTPEMQELFELLKNSAATEASADSATTPSPHDPANPTPGLDPKQLEALLKNPATDSKKPTSRKPASTKSQSDQMQDSMQLLQKSLGTKPTKRGNAKIAQPEMPELKPEDLQKLHEQIGGLGALGE